MFAKLSWVCRVAERRGERSPGEGGETSQEAYLPCSARKVGDERLRAVAVGGRLGADSGLQWAESPPRARAAHVFVNTQRRKREKEGRLKLTFDRLGGSCAVAGDCSCARQVRTSLLIWPSPPPHPHIPIFPLSSPLCSSDDLLWLEGYGPVYLKRFPF